jgi:hypothetical protein
MLVMDPARRSSPRVALTIKYFVSPPAAPADPCELEPLDLPEGKLLLLLLLLLLSTSSQLCVVHVQCTFSFNRVVVVIVDVCCLTRCSCLCP